MATVSVTQTTNSVSVSQTTDAVTVSTPGVSSEQIQDIIGAMLSSNTETGIAVTYEDSDATLDFVLAAAQTTITSLLATDIKIGEDDETKIDFETADEIHFYAANAEQVYVADGIFGPQTDSDVDLGSTSVRWKDAFVDSINVGGAVTAASASLSGAITVAGDADINGSVDVDGTLEADAITVDDVALNEYIADTVGAMVGSNTETGIAVSYDDSDNTLDFVLAAAQSTVTSLGTLTALTVDNVAIDGTTIGHTSDTDLMTLSSGVLTVAGEVDATSLDISGDADIDGTLEADAITVGGETLAEYIADTVGAMVGSNTETNITVTYEDSDNTLDFVIGTLNQNTTGTAGGLSGTPNITVGDVVAASLDISGNADIDGTLEADAITVDGETLAEVIADTVGAMVGGNTETGIAVTYEDGDNTLDFVVNAAQTGITSILSTDLKIGEDDQTKIDFETADEIHFYAANAEQVYVADGVFGPQTDSDVDLGSSSVRWKDAYVDSLTSTGNVSIGGDLTVNGTTTTVNSTTVTVDDVILTLGGDSAPGSDDNKDRGIEFRYHTGSAAKVGFFGYDDSASVFTFIPDATNSSEVFSGTAGNVAFGDIAGTLTTAAQTNITSLGTLTALTVDNVAIDGATIGHTGDTDLMTLSSGVLTVAGEVDATSLDISGNADIDGTTNLDAVDIDGNVQLDGTFTVGVDDTGQDVKFFGATSGSYMLWDESQDDLILGGDSRLGIGTTEPAHLLDIHTASNDTGIRIYTTPNTRTAAELLVDSATNGNADFKLYHGTTLNTRITSNAGNPTYFNAGDVSIGNTSPASKLHVTGTVQVGVDDTGHDVKFFGATSGAYLHWDESADSLKTVGGATVDIVKDKFKIGGTAVTTTAAELNILDGVTSSTSELNILDGVTSTTAELNILDGVT